MEGRKKKLEGFGTTCFTWRRMTGKLSEKPVEKALNLQLLALNFLLSAFIGAIGKSEPIGTCSEGRRKDRLNQDDYDEN